MVCAQSALRIGLWFQGINGGFSVGKKRSWSLKLQMIYCRHSHEHFCATFSWTHEEKLVKVASLMFALLTSATLIHFSSSRALCWLRRFVDQRHDAKTALANLLNWRTVARTDQQTSSLPFLSLWDHSDPRQWYGTRRTNSSWCI